MRKNKILFTIFIIIQLCFESFSQDTLFLIDGKKKIGDVYEINDSTIYFQVWYKDKQKGKIFFRSEVYSIHTRDTFLIVYKKDTTEGDYFSPAEMQKYMAGEKYASDNYRSPFVTTGGIISGIVGGCGQIPLFWGLLIPTAYTIAVGLKSPAIEKQKTLANQALKNDKHFIYGYKSMARKKKVINGIKGSAIGFIFMVTFMTILAK